MSETEPISPLDFLTRLESSDEEITDSKIGQILSAMLEVILKTLAGQ